MSFDSKIMPLALFLSQRESQSNMFQHHHQAASNFLWGHIFTGFGIFKEGDILTDYKILGRIKFLWFQFEKWGKPQQ